MAYGVTDQGFNKKTLDEALTELNDALVEAFGAVNTEPDSLFGQINGIIAEIVGDLWDKAEETYKARYSSSANGNALDEVAELIGVSRLLATSSSVLAIIEGTDGTAVPAGTQFLQNATNEVFQNPAPVTIDDADMLKAVFSVNAIGGAPHTLDIVTTTYGTDSYSSALTSTALAILNDIAGQINTMGKHKAVVDTTAETITITNLTASETESFDISTYSASLTLDEIWTPISLEAVNTGAIEVPANSIQGISTPVSGMSQVDTLIAGTKGRDIETDDAFRLRRKQSLAVLGAGSESAIEARLVEDINEVTYAVVKSNRTSVTDQQGRPPKSFEAIVTYSPDTSAVRQAIVDKIWEVKPAGIQTFGNQSATITDSAGDTHTIFFSAPVLKYVHINLEITLNAEETFPSTGEDDIKQAIADFGNALIAGDDVIRQRFFNSVYSVEGVKNIQTFDLAITENPLDTPSALITSDTISAETEAGLYTITGPLITSGVVSGMVVKDTATGNILTTVRSVNSETVFRADDDLFNVADQIDIGGFGAVNLGINASEQAVFSVSRINITIL